MHTVRGPELEEDLRHEQDEAQDALASGVYAISTPKYCDVVPLNRGDGFYLGTLRLNTSTQPSGLTQTPERPLALARHEQSVSPDRLPASLPDFPSPKPTRGSLPGEAGATAASFKLPPGIPSG